MQSRKNIGVRSKCHHIKDGCIYWSDKRKKWIAQVYVPKTDKNSPPVKRTKTCLSFSEAQEKLQELLARYRSSHALAAERMSAGEWLRQWFFLYSLPHIRPSTAYSYAHILRFGIRAFGDVPLARLTPLHLQACINGQMGSHYRTAAYFSRLMKMAFSRAVALGLLPKSPADSLVLPQKPYQKEFSPLTADERETLLHAKTPLACWQMLILLELATGMRRGELLGLQWDDIDLRKGIIFVRHALINGLVRDGKTMQRQLILSQPKTPSSMRKLFLPRSVCYALNAYQNSQRKARMQHGIRENRGYVFTKDDGSLIAPDYFSSCFHRVKAQICPQLTFHRLRHDFASRMLNSHEFSAKEIQRQLGHSSVKITLDTYAHLSENASPKVGKWLEDTLFRESDMSC